MLDDSDNFADLGTDEVFWDGSRSSCVRRTRPEGIHRYVPECPVFGTSLEQVRTEKANLAKCQDLIKISVDLFQI